ncbi:PfkB family carbohydrate kinase [Pseudarthrobacter sp. So.54]
MPVTSIDTVGAGDAFTAGYLSALLDGEGVVAGCTAAPSPELSRSAR